MTATLYTVFWSLLFDQLQAFEKSVIPESDDGLYFKLWEPLDRNVDRGVRELLEAYLERGVVESGRARST